MASGATTISSVTTAKSFINYNGTVTGSLTTNTVFMGISLVSSIEVDGTNGGSASVSPIDGYFNVFEGN